nr:hypothetical protein GCM10017547_09590 [Pseudarthrobacter oxydans]
MGMENGMFRRSLGRTAAVKTAAPAAAKRMLGASNTGLFSGLDMMRRSGTQGDGVPGGRDCSTIAPAAGGR